MRITAELTHRAPAFDQWRRVLPNSGTYALVAAAIEATADVRTRASKGLPKRKRKAADQLVYETQAHAVLSALVNRELTLPGGWTRIPLAHQRTGRKGKDVCSRYRSSAMSRSLPTFVHALANIGWLELVPGYIDRKERIHSIMRASAKLVADIKVYGCKQSDFTRDQTQELIVLKARKPDGRDSKGRPRVAEWIDYIDTPETHEMRAQMAEVNDWLSSLDAEYLGPGDGVDAKGDRTLWRVFNNGTFEEGGRLVGGFWSNMSMSARKDRPWRANIRIEGEPIVALDFVSMFMRLLYVEAGVQPPSGDLLACIQGLSPEYRTATKRVMYSMLFQEGELTRCPRGTRLLLPKGSHIRTHVKNIKRRHAPVAHLFGSGIGMRLFKRESTVLLEALRLCRTEGIAALPVHDAILVAQSKADAARAVMLKAFANVTGFQGEVGEPKRPHVNAEELEHMPMPDEVRELEDSAEHDDGDLLWRVKMLLREGFRDDAIALTRKFLEERVQSERESPDAVRDWI